MYRHFVYEKLYKYGARMYEFLCFIGKEILVLTFVNALSFFADDDICYVCVVFVGLSLG